MLAYFSDKYFLLFTDLSARAIAVLSKTCRYNCMMKFSRADIMRLQASYDSNPHKTPWVVTQLRENKSIIEGKRQLLLDGNMVCNTNSNH